MVVMVEELVYDEKGCPVSPVCVDEEREGAKLPVRSGPLVVERGQDEHQDYLGDTEHYLSCGSSKCRHLTRAQGVSSPRCDSDTDSYLLECWSSSRYQLRLVGNVSTHL